VLPEAEGLLGQLRQPGGPLGGVEPGLEHRLVVEVDDDDPLVAAAGRRVDLGRLVAGEGAGQRRDLALPRQEGVGPSAGKR
jgi:hypothetical protein